MSQFNGEVVILAGTIKTIQQLIQAAVAARTYAAAHTGHATAADREAEEIARWNGAIAKSGYLRPIDGDIYLMDAYKGVFNGVVTNSHDGVTLLATDFNAGTAGEGSAWIPGQAKDLAGVYLGGQVVYAVADTVIALDNVVVI